ncbi:MAG TPA: hypothetical protein V6D19_11430, partial [Stenomitos sp.]
SMRRWTALRMPEDKPTAKDEAPKPTHADLLAEARALNADHKLTPAWTQEKLLHKPPGEFKDSELVALKTELESFTAEYNKNNAT